MVIHMIKRTPTHLNITRTIKQMLSSPYFGKSSDSSTKAKIPKLKMQALKKTLKCQNGPTNTFTISSPIGNLELIACPRGIHALQFLRNDLTPEESPEPDKRVEVGITAQLYEDNGYTYKPALQCVDWLSAYFRGCTDTLTASPPICYPAHSKDSFTQKVWQTLLNEIQFGDKISYGELAKKCGNEKGARAVGQAMRNNNVLLVIPCHRVVLGSGATGNYSSGHRNNIKVWLLQHEQEQHNVRG